MPKILLGDVGKFRKYKFSSVRDLIRLIRNKSHHFLDLEDAIKTQVGSSLSGFIRYLQQLFPNLLLHVYTAIVCSTPTSSAVCAEKGCLPASSPDSFEGKYVLGLSNERIVRVREKKYSKRTFRSWFQPEKAWICVDEKQPVRKRPFFSAQVLG